MLEQLNQNIEDTFCSPELAKLLKEKGFAALCHRYDDAYGQRHITFYKNDPLLPNRTYIPTHDVVRQWLKVNFGWHITTVPRSWEPEVVKWSVWGNNIKDHYFHIEIDDRDNDDPYDTEEEAIEAAITYLLKNRI